MRGSGRSPGEGNGNPLQYSCLENPMHRGAWQAVVHGVSRVGHNLVTKPPPPHKDTIDTLKEKIGGKGISIDYLTQYVYHTILTKILRYTESLRCILETNTILSISYITSV